MNYVCFASNAALITLIITYYFSLLVLVGVNGPLYIKEKWPTQHSCFPAAFLVFGRRQAADQKLGRRLMN